MIDPVPLPPLIPGVVIGRDPRDMTLEEKVECVYELVGTGKPYSHTKVVICLHEAASWILNFINRTQLPKELYWVQIRMAVDLLLYRTPDVGANDAAYDPLFGQLQRIKQDDVEFEGQDADRTFALSMDTQNLNMKWLKDYAAQLKKWRLLPRGARRGHC